MAKIIFLMGVSSTGKTLLANQLVKLMPEEHFSIEGLDHAVEKLDKKYWPNGECQHEGFYFIDGPNGPKMQRGPVGDQFLEFMISDIIQKAKSGQNIIIDYVPSDEDIARFNTELPEAAFITIGLKPPIEWVIENEKKRGDRKVGIAEQGYQHFYHGKHFDITQDTSKQTPNEAAKIIKSYIDRSKASMNSNHPENK